MHQQPDDLDPRDLARTLRERWGLDVPPAALSYAPLGFGDHHWTAGDGQWFVTVAEAATPGRFAALRQALETAAALHERLDFVVAPVPALDGRIVVRLDERYAVTVYPYIPGVPGHFGDRLPEADRIALARTLARLHAAPPAVAATAPVHEPALLPHRPALEAALAALDTPWSGGPYAERTRALLASHGAEAVRATLARFDADAERVTRTAERVLTHGEPHPGNVLRLGERLLLIDWDTAALAPPARDLWLAAGSSAPALRAYSEASGREVPAADLGFYALRWALDDISIYVDEFRGPHGDSPDTEVAWSGLCASLKEAVGGA